MRSAAPGPAPMKCTVTASPMPIALPGAPRHRPTDNLLIAADAPRLHTRTTPARRQTATTAR
jgi:hypothetical protein